MDIPDGYGPLPRSSPFLDMVGPVLCRRNGEGLELALRIEQRHCNSRGYVHGGLLTAIADQTLGYNIGLMGLRDSNLTLITASLTIDFTASATLGDWLNVSAEMVSCGKRLGFANCYLVVGDKRVARASGVFSVVPRKQ
jgi:uncharacterized protein (TIGR00369 family)